MESKLQKEVSFFQKMDGTWLRSSSSHPEFLPEWILQGRGCEGSGQYPTVILHQSAVKIGAGPVTHSSKCVIVPCYNVYLCVQRARRAAVNKPGWQGENC